MLRLILTKKKGTIKSAYAFDLMKIVEKDGLPMPVNTYDLYRETGDEKLLSDIRFFVNRFADRDIFKEVQRTYTLSGE